MSWFSETFTLRNIATAAMLVVTGGQYGWYLAAAYAASAEYGRSEAKRAQNQAREAWNAAQKDRQLVVRSTVAPRQIVLGKTVLGGAQIYANSFGTNRKYLHVVLALAGHEVDAIEGIIINDVLQPAWNSTT
jgi:hypothetical protein